jgi:hypothetical protein
MPVKGAPGKDFPRPLIGMSLRQDNPGGLLSSRARFRFSCRIHSATEAKSRQRFFIERQVSPPRRVSSVDKPQ